MSGYQDWSLDGWRTHLPGVTDVADYVTRLGGQSLPRWRPRPPTRCRNRVAVTVDGEPLTHAALDQALRPGGGVAGPAGASGDRVLLAAGSASALCAATWARCEPGP